MNDDLQAARDLTWGLAAAILTSGVVLPPSVAVPPNTSTELDDLRVIGCVVAARALRDLVRDSASGGLLDAADVLEVARRYDDAAETLGATVTS